MNRNAIETGKMILGVIAFICSLFILAYSDTHYTRIGTVEKQAENNYYFYDSVGNVWEFSADEEIDSDMNVEVLMFDNCTKPDYDDMIINYKVLPKNKNKK